jgi:hypothetical protein
VISNVSPVPTNLKILLMFDPGTEHRVHILAAVGRLGSVTFRLDRVDRAIQNAPKGFYRRGRLNNRDIVFLEAYRIMDREERMDAILEDLKIKANELGGNGM